VRVTIGDSQAIAEWDWLISYHGERLHAPAKWDDPAEDMTDADAVAACGLATTLTIPGVLSRMSVPRCSKCCRVTGYPPGKGSPKNDKRCRPLVEQRLVAELRG